MSNVLEAYFGIKVWKSTKTWKHDPKNNKRKYVVYEITPDFEHLVLIFTKHMTRENLEIVTRDDVISYDFVSDDDF